MVRLLLVPFFLGLAACSHEKQIKRDSARVAADLQDKLLYTQIAPGAPELEDLPALASFVLTLKSDPVAESYLFSMKEYVIQTGGDPLLVPTRNICEVIDRMYEADTATVAKYLKEAELGLGVSLGIFELGTNVKLGLAEALYSLDKISRIKNSRVLVAIKGYADGQHASWTDTLRSNYLFDSVTVLKPAKEGDNPFSYIPRDSVIRIRDRTYDNSHLPDLRAEFVRREFIDPYLRRCEEEKEFRTEVKILKGFEYDAPDMPQNRKVQVFVYIFEDA